MICKKCGKEMPEGTAFCAYCGTPFEEAPAAPQAGMPWGAVINSRNPKAASPDNKKKLVLIIGGAVTAVVLVAVILLCVLLIPRGSSGSSSGSSPEKVFKAFVTGTFSCDVKKVWNNSIMAKEAQKALDTYNAEDYEEYYQDTKSEMDDLKADFKSDGIKYKVTIDINQVEKIGKDDREFDWAKELLEDYYDCNASKVKEFAIVEAKIEAEYYEDGDRDRDNDVDPGRKQYLLIKIGDNWYMTDFSRDNIKSYLKDYYK